MHKITKLVLSALVAAVLVVPSVGAAASGSASGSQSTGSSSGGGSSGGSSTGLSSSSSARTSKRAMESHAKHVVREFIKAVNSNDVDRVMSFYTKDAQLWDPPDCNPCKGRALRRVEVRDAADHFHVNVSQLKANGNVVSGKFKATSDSIRKSGMRRVTGTFEMTLRGDKIAVLRVHPATS